MKEQLESLATEMLSEVKNIKDLAKEELPLIAKEYLNFEYKCSLALATLTGIIAITAAYYGFTHVTENKYDQNSFMVFMALIFILAGIPTVINLINALEVKLMPRTSAIRAITRLFRT